MHSLGRHQGLLCLRNPIIHTLTKVLHYVDVTDAACTYELSPDRSNLERFNSTEDKHVSVRIAQVDFRESLGKSGRRKLLFIFYTFLFWGCMLRPGGIQESSLVQSTLWGIFVVLVCESS